VARKDWNVRIQGPYRHGAGVVNYLSRYLQGGPIKDHRLVQADASAVSFGYRDHRDGKEKTMTLKAEDFIRRVLWHVPVKGQHSLRYYGLYVPGAKSKRDAIREQLKAPTGEAVITAPKPERTCPHCGAVLFHHKSTRRKISYIKNNRHPASGGSVQQAVGADDAGLGWPLRWGRADVFLSGVSRLN
jgi:hypothetical protein